MTSKTRKLDDLKANFEVSRASTKKVRESHNLKLF